MKLKLKKCKFFKKEVAFLGRLASEHGYRIDPENTKAVSTLKGNPPKTVGDVRKIVGFLVIMIITSRTLQKLLNHCMNC